MGVCFVSQSVVVACAHDIILLWRGITICDHDLYVRGRIGEGGED